jgi:hypothetical protein
MPGVAAPGLFAPILARLAQESARHFGTAVVRLTPTSYQERPFSHLLGVSVSRPRSGRGDVDIFIKVFKPKPLDGGVEKMRHRVLHEFHTTRRIHEALAGSTELGAVRPVACYVEHLAIVTERVEGSTLLAHLQAHAAWFPHGGARRSLEETLGAVGRWLRVFQSIDRGSGRVSVSALRAYVDIRLERLVRYAAGFTEADRRRVLDHLERLGGDAAPKDLEEVPVHADLALGNVLVSNRRIVLLDFAMANRGSYLHDASRLYVQLDLLLVKPQFRPSVIRGLQLALLQGLDPSLEPDRPLFRFFLLLHRINHLGTLVQNHASFPGSTYNGLVRRRHRLWIDRELGRS